MKIYKFGIIGLGTIAKSYLKAFNEIPHLKLVAVCDKNRNAPAYSLYKGVPNYIEYKQMFENEDIDYVLISTPPSTHYHIAKDCLNANVNTIVEKPAVLNIDELEELYQLAKDKLLFFDCLFHWHHANEVQYLMNNYLKKRSPDLIKITIEDPYTLDDAKTIKDSKVPLNGTWYDSGVNSLSFLSLIVPLEELKLVNKKILIDKEHNLPYYSEHIYMRGKQQFIIHIDWSKKIPNKYTLINFESKKLRIIHHLEEIYDDNTLVFKGVSKNRLAYHYYNYFLQFNDKKMNEKRVLEVHKKLFNEGAM